MLSALKNNIYPALALITLPVGYFIGTELRERNDAKVTQVVSEEDIQKLKQQLETLREEREMVLCKIQKWFIPQMDILYNK